MLNEKQAMQRLFCYYYAFGGNIEESAIKAGFPQELALSEGIKILSLRKFQALISELCRGKIDTRQSVAGLKRLAFGSVNDAFELVFSEGDISKERLAKMDFFNISEIKKIKGGGVEIKIFDRQKALEKLLEHENASCTKPAFEIIDALKNMHENSFDDEE